MKPIVVLDGDCALCHRVAQLIDRWDPSGDIRIATTRTEPGRTILKKHGHDPEDPLTWLYLEEGMVYEHLDAMIRISTRLEGPIRILVLFAILPAPVKKWLYRIIAHNRYRLFGSASLCATSSKTLRGRLLIDKENTGWTICCWDE